ncbi:hypothetical protein E2C01_035141 [Portunus trituberculatus]|uniref:Uncharacterized protein n=1 Tax=Portunus trituberculatus TaxID=210409 RepID=A0A5B7F4W8_PORTR|nr:hypothetical protein [Portunus trituberculatus]
MSPPPSTPIHRNAHRATEDDGTEEGHDGHEVPSSSQDLFGTSLDIAGPLDMSMKGPPPTPGVNIHLQTSMNEGGRPSLCVSLH